MIFEVEKVSFVQKYFFSYFFLFFNLKKFQRNIGKFLQICTEPIF